METSTHAAPPVDLDRLVRLWELLRYNRYTLFAGIVWRPVTGDEGDAWLQSWRKYRMSWQTAWDVACVIYPLPNLLLTSTSAEYDAD